VVPELAPADLSAQRRHQPRRGRPPARQETAQ
jgi:hypothetical protein